MRSTGTNVTFDAKYQVASRELGTDLCTLRWDRKRPCNIAARNLSFEQSYVAHHAFSRMYHVFEEVSHLYTPSIWPFRHRISIFMPLFILLSAIRRKIVQPPRDAVQAEVK